LDTRLFGNCRENETGFNTPPNVFNDLAGQARGFCSRFHGNSQRAGVWGSDTLCRTLIPMERVRVALVGDGAKWLWTHMKAAFPTGKEILDYYHCSERIHKVAQIQYSPDQNQQAL
jgi:hypothetical protein